MSEPVDPRCFEHDHHFADEDLYDLDGQSLGREAQLAAKCVRCGMTMKESVMGIIAEIESRLAGKLQ